MSTGENLQPILDIVASYSRNPQVLKQVSTDWYKYLKKNDRQIMEGLQRSYPGFGTTFERLREAIKQNDIETVSAVANQYAGYLPINWDSLAEYVKSKQMFQILWMKISDKEAKQMLALKFGDDFLVHAFNISEESLVLNCRTLGKWPTELGLQIRLVTNCYSAEEAEKYILSFAGDRRQGIAEDVFLEALTFNKQEILRMLYPKYINQELVLGYNDERFPGLKYFMDMGVIPKEGNIAAYLYDDPLYLEGTRFWAQEIMEDDRINLFKHLQKSDDYNFIDYLWVPSHLTKILDYYLGDVGNVSKYMYSVTEHEKSISGEDDSEHRKPIHPDIAMRLMEVAMEDTESYKFLNVIDFLLDHNNMEPFEKYINKSNMIGISLNIGQFIIRKNMYNFLDAMNLHPDWFIYYLSEYGGKPPNIDPLFWKQLFTAAVKQMKTADARHILAKASQDIDEESKRKAIEYAESKGMKI